MPIVIVKYRVKKDKCLFFEKWLEKIFQAAQKYRGYLGAEIMQPSSYTAQYYTCIFRFDSLENLEPWMQSDERNRLLSELKGVFISTPVFQQHSVIQSYYTSSDTEPSRHKMALITFISIWLLVHIIMNYLHPLLPGPALFKEMVVVAIIVYLMTYVVMPPLVMLFPKWLAK